MTLNNQLFFGLNYGEFASITGTNLNTVTAYFAYDYRSDTGMVNFNSTTGEFIYDFGSGTSFNIDSMLVLNHNFQNFSLAVTLTNTGVWTTLTAYTNQTITSHYYNIGSSTIVYDAKVNYTSTQDGAVGQMGEFIVTIKNFQLAYNPDIYQPKMTPIMTKNILWTGKGVFAKKAESYFTANIGWSALQGNANYVGNTDLQNVTELARKNTSFIYWPNANNTTQNLYTWRAQDIYKCKISSPVVYEWYDKSVDYIIKGTGFLIEEIV